MKNNVKIPVVLFLFKRKDTLNQIIERIKQYGPTKIYLIADAPRNEEEKKAVDLCRREAESLINWDCKVVKNYAETNRGVYKNIGEGALWVFKNEDRAIFLEDDNLPSPSFFPFCEKMLEKYENNERVLWICGSNYLGKTNFKNNSSYSFTRHMLPCGWASWGSKFTKYYDGKLKNFELSRPFLKTIKSHFLSKTFYRYDKSRWLSEYYRIINDERPNSWDYQMAFSIRFNNLLGIIPKYNQITNIGVDDISIHGGNSIKNVMVNRFCENPSYVLESILVDPETVGIDKELEKKLNRIILPPIKMRLKSKIKLILIKFKNKH